MHASACIGLSHRRQAGGRDARRALPATAAWRARGAIGLTTAGPAPAAGAARWIDDNGGGEIDLTRPLSVRLTVSCGHAQAFRPSANLGMTTVTA